MLREVKREKDVTMLTGLLVSGKPYLCHDQNSGQFHVLYWKEHDRDGKWGGSDFYIDPACTAKQNLDRPGGYFNEWPKRGKFYELPGVDYGQPIHQEVREACRNRRNRNMSRGRLAAFRKANGK